MIVQFPIAGFGVKVILPRVCCVVTEILTAKLAPGAQSTELPCVTVTLFVFVMLTDKVVVFDTLGGQAA